MLVSRCETLDALLFTHEHSDHTAGLDDIRPFFFKQQKNIPVYAHERVLENLKQRFDYIFATENKYPGAPSVDTFEVQHDVPFRLGNMIVTPINVGHGSLQVFGYRLQDFVYLTDVKTVDEGELVKLKDVKVLVVNALREEPHHSHFSLQDALDFIHLVQPERAYITHISHLMGFHAVVQEKLPANVYLAYDNLEINI
jgi:phosphoribosyl 1,2-cyclic phosphate phosphodiesterase